MKSFADLERIREETLAGINLRRSQGAARVVVGMGESGLGTGAREVLRALMEEIEARSLQHVQVLQKDMNATGHEPVVCVQLPGQEAVAYGDVTPELAREIVRGHLEGGVPLEGHVIAWPGARQ